MRTVQEILNAVIDNGHYMPELVYMCNSLSAAWRAGDITEEEFLHTQAKVQEFVDYGASLCVSGIICMRVVAGELLPNSKLTEHWYEGGGVWFYRNWDKRERVLNGDLDYVQR